MKRILVIPISLLLCVAALGQGELIARRTYKSKTYKQGNVYTTNLHVGHIHYKDAQGDFQDVDYSFEDMGMYWRMTKASYRLYVAKDFGASQLIRFDNKFEGANHSIYFEPHSIWWVNMDNKSERTKWKDALSVQGYLTGPNNDTIRWDNCFAPGVHFEVKMRRSGFVKYLVVDSKPLTAGAPYANWSLAVVAKFTGSGLKVRLKNSTEWDDDTYYEGEDDFDIYEVTTGLKSEILHAWGQDAADRRVSLPVFFEKRNGALWQGKIIPSAMINNATYPIRVDTTTNYYQGAGDGIIFRWGAAEGWNTNHDAAAGTTAAYIASDHPVGSFFHTGNNNAQITRAFLPVNTAGLPDDAIISSSTQYVYFYQLDANSDNDGDDFIQLIQTNQPDPTLLTTNDYNNCGATDNPTAMSDTKPDISSINLAAYTAFPLNATGLAAINVSGYTMFGMREGHDVLDHPIDGAPGSDTIRWYTSEQTGTSNDPYLEVTYTTGGPPPEIPGTWDVVLLGGAKTAGKSAGKIAGKQD